MIILINVCYYMYINYVFLIEWLIFSMNLGVWCESLIYVLCILYILCFLWYLLGIVVIEWYKLVYEIKKYNKKLFN